MFAKFLKSAKKVQNQNIFEAVIAASLLVASADGEIEQSELKKLEKLLSSNDNLSSFKGSEINRIITKYSSVLEADFEVGKMRMLREIEDVAGNPDDGEEVFLNALAIAKADNEIDDKEKAILTKLGSLLGVSVSEYGL
jgi:tellurite resistance protein TerB